MKTSASAARTRRRSHRSSQPAAKARSGLLASLKKQSFLLGLALAITTVVVYFPVSHHPFVNYDDLAYIVDNPHISAGLDWDTVGWAFTTFDQFTWHPLTWLSHALDVQFFQLEPGGPHVMNMLWQVMNVLLLFWVLRRATGYVGRSAMVAGLFALHPLNVESVAWIAERKNLLSMMFFLLGLAAYRWYVAGSQRKPNVGRYTLVALLFALGLMCKPQIITFPFVLLLWDYWPLQRLAVQKSAVLEGTLTEPLPPARSFWFLVKEKTPLFLICAASAVMTVLSQKLATLGEYPFSIRLGYTFISYVKYLGKAVWPTRLAPMYPHPWHASPLWQVTTSLLLVAVITALVLAARIRGYLLVGWLWFLGTLVPMIGLVHVGNHAMADRYTYLPFIGLFIMACWGVSDLASRQRVPAVVMWGASMVVLLTLAIVTRHQLNYWNDNVTLWTHTLQVTNDNYIAHDNLAQLLMQRGQPDEAMKHYHTALAIYASDPSSNLSIAVYDHQHGRLHEAIARYDQMITITPDGPARAELFSNRGLVYLDLRDSAEAQQSFDKAVALDPHNYRAWLGLGVLAARSGDAELAIQNLRRAIAAKPTAIAYSLLAQALQQTGHTAEAQAARDQARMLSKSGTPQAIAEGVLGQ